MHVMPLRKLNAEVMDVQFDAIWQAFAETGDPLYYLLYRAAQQADRAKSGKEQTSTRTAAVRI